MIYNLGFINSVKNDIISKETLPENVETIIQELSNKVLSPSYSKTPVFNKKKHINYNKFNSLKTTTKILKENNSFNEINSLFNKLSKTNEESTSKKIVEFIKTATLDERKSCIDLFFDIKTDSSVFIKIYSNLLKYIYQNVSEMKPMLIENINNIVSKKNDLSSNVSSKNYDVFCKNNERMTKYTSQLLIITSLVIYGIVEKDILFTALNKLKMSIQKNIKDETKKQEIEYTIKNMCKIMNEMYTLEQENDLLEEYNSFLVNVIGLCSLKHINKGLSNKTGFIIMDYCDEIGLEY